MEKHIVYSGRAVISYRWLVSPEGQLSLEKVKERDVGIMSTPFVNTLFFCVLAVIGRICDTSQISVWLCFDEQCCEVCTVPDFPVHSYNAMHFCDSNKKPRCYSGDFASSRSSTVSTNCCKTNPCAGSVHHLWAQCSSALKQLLFTTSVPGVQRYTTSAPYARQDCLLLMSEGVMAAASP